jgi:hypothetical protein
MIDYDHNKDFTNHKCVIIIDANKKTVRDAKPQPYDMMVSGTKTKQPNFIYLGFGTAHSCYSKELKREVSLSGSGHFYISKKKK